MKLKKIRNALLVVLTLALVSATAVAATWAYTEGKFGEKEVVNTFGNESIDAELTEWEWDGDKSQTDPNDDHQINDKTTVTLGQNIAKSYSPNQEIPKNPSISNISDTTNTDSATPKEWVAMTVRYYLKSGVQNDDNKYYFDGYKEFSDAVARVMHDDGTTKAIGFNETDWDPKVTATTAAVDKDRTVFYYNQKVNNWASTNTIFDDVKINATFTPTNDTGHVGEYKFTGLTALTSGNQKITDTNVFNGTLYTTSLPEFHIELQGYAVQAETNSKAKASDTLGTTEVPYATAKGELDKMIAADPITIALS